MWRSVFRLTMWGRALRPTFVCGGASTAHAPLLKLDRAHIPGLRHVVGQGLADKPSLSWTVSDGGARECWAIVAPSADQGGQARQALRDVCTRILMKILLGRQRPRLADNLAMQHASVFASLPLRSIAHVSFETRHPGSGDFVDYATRYGSIRGTDRVTLFEHLMESCGIYTGAIARQHMRPDPLACSQDDTGLLKWESQSVQEKVVQEARLVRERIHAKAPLLGLEALLTRPVIALSNGQTRRARILQALLAGAKCVVMEEPFTGLDPPTRQDVSGLFASLHAQRAPRLLLFLREQDPIPDFVTHVLRINEPGDVTQLGPKSEAAPASTASYPPGGYAVVKGNASRGRGLGDQSQHPIISMRDVSLSYGSADVLQHVSLDLWPGSRMVLVGDNGSGKTTLLSLLLGDHPRSFAIPQSQLSLFGRARYAPQNAHILLQKRMGHLSPELYIAFPRKNLKAGGLTVADAVSSGFDGIFTYRRRSEAQMARVYQLLGLFASELVSQSPSRSATSIERLADTPLTDLTHGSQALVLLLRAIVHRPALLVLDEPFQGMSSRQLAKARAFLDATDDRWVYDGMPAEEQALDRTWRQQLALVIVSHYEAEWPLSCGRLLRLSAGQVMEQW